MRSLEIIGAELGRAGLGRLKISLAMTMTLGPTSCEMAGHHIGNDPHARRSSNKGVVDENCRVHGSANLFLAGSSVFPTSGHANPTLTHYCSGYKVG